MRCSVLRGLVIRPGTRADWRALARFHYRSKHVGVATRIWVAVLPVADERARFGAGSGADPPEALRLGVLVEALPLLACRLRDRATGGAYAAGDAAARAVLLNRDFRCLARVVVHPRFRGAGVAVRLVRWALGHAETPYVEALAAMGRVVPFFAAAGMTAYDWPADEPGRRAPARPVYYLWRKEAAPREPGRRGGNGQGSM